MIYGGVINHRWADLDSIRGKKKGGEQYRLYSATRYLGVTTGSAVQEDGGTSPFIRFSLPGDVKDNDVVVALGGTWNALPRVPKVQNVNQSLYQSVVHDLLTRKGLPDAKVNITHLWRIDLEGDGNDEVLINAMTPRNDFSRDTPYKQNDYSMILLRKVIKGEVQTIPVGLSFYKHNAPPDVGWDGVPTIYTLEGCFDLNGDGIMEIVVHTDALPDLWDTIYRVHGTTITGVLSAGEWV